MLSAGILATATALAGSRFCSFIPAVRSGARRIMAPGPFRRAKSMPRMLRSRSRGVSLPRSLARALRSFNSSRWGRSDSEEGRASSHSLARGILKAKLTSNTFEIEWPPRSGRRQSFPEVDRAEWFNIEFARTKMLSGQVELLDRLLAIAVETSGSFAGQSFRTGCVGACTSFTGTLQGGAMFRDPPDNTGAGVGYR
jgi:hypothetical protein